MAHIGYSFLCVRFAVTVEFGTSLLSVIICMVRVNSPWPRVTLRHTPYSFYSRGTIGFPFGQVAVSHT